MTAMVVLDAQQNLDQTLTVDLDDLDFLKVSRRRSAANSPAARMRLALMSSENRAASSLGRFYPQPLQRCGRGP